MADGKLPMDLTFLNIWHLALVSWPQRSIAPSYAAYLWLPDVLDAGAVFNVVSVPGRCLTNSLGKPSPRQYISPSSQVPATGERSKQCKALMSKRVFLPRSSKQLLCLILPYPPNTLGKWGDGGNDLGILS